MKRTFLAEPSPFSFSKRLVGALPLTVSTGKMELPCKYRKVHFTTLTVALTAFFGQVLFAQKSTGDALSFAYSVEPFYKCRSDGKPGRAITIFLTGELPRGTVTVKVVCDSVTETTVFNSTDTSKQLLVLLPVGAGVAKVTKAGITVTAGGRDLSAIIPVPPKKQWTVFIYPHSHVDIGYTGLQEDVERLHVRNVDVGIDLAKKTAHYPEGARFVWNTEATWVVKAYLKKATESQRRSFLEAVKKGWVQIDAGYANLNTTVCSDEEILRFFENSNEIEKLINVSITTMVQMDVPGAAWGLVQAAAQNGVTGFISFPNYFDLRKVWEHKPFYWKGPDGKSRVLFLQAYPYGIGYTLKGSKYGLAKLQTFSSADDRVSTEHPMENFLNPFIFEETAKLEAKASPYDLFAMTWSMADNCVIDADLPEAVKQWNETYAYPKLVIAGAKEILSAFEKKYGNIIPEYSGDFTEFWTEGLGSDAAHVGMGRRAKENLVQAEIVQALLPAKEALKEQLVTAWENVLLSTEHTWGYQTPTAPLANVIEARKAAFFSDAEKESRVLLNAFGDSAVTDEQYAVVNTLSWNRRGIVTLTPAQSKSGNRVIETATGKPVLSQRLSTGELIFETATIPALSSRLYKVVGGATLIKTVMKFTDTSLSNGLLSVSVDPHSGNIKSLIDLRRHYNVASGNGGLNSYYYLPGVYNGKGRPGTPTTADSTTVRINEKGSLMASLVVRSKADGVKWLERKITLYANEGFLQIQNSFDKIGTRKKEGLHFGFAFNLPKAVARMDAPWSVIEPETAQLQGANRNWATFQRWVDLSNEQTGVTWTAIESPLIEWGEPSGNVLDGARQYGLWKKHLEPTEAIYSWPVNNHWNTNFPLEQSGIITQDYAVLPHGAYDAAAANRFGTERQRPLVVLPAKKNLINTSLVRISNPKVVLSALKRTGDKKALVLRLRSFSEKEETVRLGWPSEKPQKIQRCTAEEEPLETVGSELTMAPYGIESLYLTF